MEASERTAKERELKRSSLSHGAAKTNRAKQAEGSMARQPHTRASSCLRSLVFAPILPRSVSILPLHYTAPLHLGRVASVTGQIEDIKPNVLFVCPATAGHSSFISHPPMAPLLVTASRVLPPTVKNGELFRNVVQIRYSMIHASVFGLWM